MEKTVIHHEHNRKIILEYERTFAARLAREILNKPQLSSWMIFIPFIFIFYFQDLSKYKKQKKVFMENYLLSREKALNEAWQALEENRKPDASALAAQAGLTEEATKKYANLIKVLSTHYTSLLCVQKDTYSEIIFSAYHRGKGDFIYFINTLSQAEKALNKALLPGLERENEGVRETIKKMEKASDKLRTKDIQSWF